MINCKTCGTDLEIAGYYKSRPGVCRACVCAQQRRVRRERVEYYKAYDRARANRPDRVAARMAYMATPEGKARHAEASRAWVERNAAKRAAHVKFGNALRDGKVQRPPQCEACFKLCVPEAHHDDYSNPLAVRWLCTACHSHHHKGLRAVARGDAA